MRIPPLSLLTSLLTLAAFCVGSQAWASPLDDDRREQMPESVRRIESETGGRVLQVRPMQRGNREIYRMKVLTPEGRIRVVQDDPRQRMRESAPMHGDMPVMQQEGPRRGTRDASPPSHEMRDLQDDGRLQMREYSEPPREVRGMDDGARQNLRESVSPPIMPSEPERNER